MSSSMNISAPELAPPGAGLPRGELQVARILFFCQSKLSSRLQGEQFFRSELHRISALINPLSSESLEQRVLIKRLPGLEDSSRYWSVAMTLEHLRIVNDEVGKVILHLVEHGEAPRVVGTADIKPQSTARSSEREKFQESASSFIARIHGLKSLQSAGKWPHPWFGKLSAVDWNFFVGFHMKLHRKQIEAVIQGLTYKNEQSS